MKRVLAMLLAALMLLSLAACDKSGNNPGNDPGNNPSNNPGNSQDPGGEAGGPDYDNPILIGLTDAFSGDRASNGEYTREGAEMFLSEINANGGVLGRAVQIVYEDDQGNETAATNAYQKLVSQNDVCATVINKYSSVVLAMEAFIASEQLPAICSGSSVNIEASDNEYLLSTRKSDAGSGTTLAALCDQLEVTKVAILHSPDALGTGMSAIVVDALAEYNIEVVSNQQFSAEEKNFAPYVAKIIDSGCDCIVTMAQTSESGLIVKAINDAGLNVPCIGNSAFAQASTIDNAGVDAIEGWYSVTAFSPTVSSEPTASWVAKYEELYGRAPEMTSATTYDALSMICWAIEKAGSDDPDAINAALHSIDAYEGIASIYTYRGNPMLATAEYIVQIQNGASVVLDRLAS